MGTQDEDLAIIAKLLLGFSQEQIARQLGSNIKEERSRERVSQRIYEFFSKLDNITHLLSPWINQCIYALGLSKYYHQKETDNGLGWEYKYFDLADEDYFRNVRAHYTPSFFDQLEIGPI
jgi:hypothetical protein